MKTFIMWFFIIPTAFVLVSFALIIVAVVLAVAWAIDHYRTRGRAYATVA